MSPSDLSDSGIVAESACPPGQRQDVEHRSPILQRESLRLLLPLHPTLPDADAPGSCSRGVDIAVRTEEAEFDKLVKGSGRLLACVKPLDFGA